MKNTIKIFSIILLVSAVANAAQTVAQFLNIDTDARLSGMASGGAASALGVNALSYNPAGLAVLKGPEVAFSHSQWLRESSHDFIGFGMPMKKFSLALGVTRLSNSKMEGRAEDGTSSGGYSAYDQAVSLGFGFKSVGGAVKYIQSSIAGVKAAAFAVDLGVRQKLNRLPVAIGFGVQNLGTGIKYLSQRDNLPLSVNAGLTLAVLPGMGLSLDMKRLVYDKQTVFSAGTEYSMMLGGAGIALRGGYGLAGLTRDKEKSGISLGAGLAALGAQLDYAVSPETGLGSVQRITLKKKF